MTTAPTNPPNVIRLSEKLARIDEGDSRVREACPEAPTEIGLHPSNLYRNEDGLAFIEICVPTGAYMITIFPDCTVPVVVP